MDTDDRARQAAELRRLSFENKTGHRRRKHAQRKGRESVLVYTGVIDIHVNRLLSIESHLFWGLECPAQVKPIGTSSQGLDVCGCRIKTCKDFVQPLAGGGADTGVREATVLVSGFLARLAALEDH